MICLSLRIDKKECSPGTSEIIDYNKFELRDLKSPDPEDQSSYDTCPQNVHCEYVCRHRSHFRKGFTSYRKKRQIQQDEITKTRQVKITAEPKPSGNKPIIIIAGDSLLKNINGWLMSRSKE